MYIYTYIYHLALLQSARALEGVVQLRGRQLLLLFDTTNERVAVGEWVVLLVRVVVPLTLKHRVELSRLRKSMSRGLQAPCSY